jgi:hypothetical protein
LSDTGGKWEYNGTVHHLFIGYRREVLYNILTELDMLMKLFRPIKMCLIKTYRKAYVGKYLFNVLPIQNGLKHAMSPWLSTFL